MQSPQPTVAEVLALPEVQAGAPVVLAGASGLDRRVRWVHVLELPHVEGLLRGGELVLTTGVALPAANDGLRGYVRALDYARVSGVLLELGERWTTAPPALVRAADRAGLPLVGLRTEVPFVAITESVHASIVSRSTAELQAAERVYALFARRGTAAAPVNQVLQDVAEMTGAPVVLESPAHRVVDAVLTGHDPGAVLADWERRSRQTPDPDDTTETDGRSGPEGWLVRPVAARGQRFGRLVVQPGPDAVPRLTALILERAADALAVGLLLRADGPHLQAGAQARLLADLVDGRFRTEREAYLQAAAAGVPLLRRTLTGLFVAGSAEVAGVLRAAEHARQPVLTASGLDGVAVLAPVPLEDDPALALAHLTEALYAELAAVLVGRGATVTALPDLAASLRDARAAAVAGQRGGAPARLIGLGDVGVHGLLAQWGDDARLAAFVDRTLGPLLGAGPASAVLVEALRAFLAAGGNKSAASAALHVSRPTLYARLDAVQARLGVDLEQADVRLALHLALAARDSAGGLTALQD